MLALGGKSLLLPHTPAQARPKVAMAGITAHAAPTEDGDGDGDELLEHWGDPKYRRSSASRSRAWPCSSAAGALSRGRRRDSLRREARRG